MESASLANEGFFQGCGGVKMSQSVLKKLQEIKELKRQQRNLLLQRSHYNNNHNTDPSDVSLDDSLEQSSIKSGCFSTGHDSNKENKKSNSYEEEIENSFEKTSSPAINFDDLPVTNIAHGGKTFEQVIEEQLQQDRQQLLPVNMVPVSKQSFLRKGQGTARFNGPPHSKITRRKPTIKSGVPLQVERDEKVIQFIEGKAPPDKPPVRKTARLRRREAIRKQYLQSHQTSTRDRNETILAPRHPVTERSLPDIYLLKSVIEQKKRGGNDYTDEEEWSDATTVDDTILTLETTELEHVLKFPADPDQSSNETFERIERYCNKKFDVDDVASFDLDAPLNLRREVDKIRQSTEPCNLLVHKLFPPWHKPVTTKQQVEMKPFCTDSDQPKPDAILKRKLEELQTEIRLFQIENEALVKSRAEFESGVEELRKQTEEFQKLKHQELADIAQYRESERANLMRDYQMFEHYVSASKKNFPSKEEIRELEEQLEQVRAEAKVKEERLCFKNARLSMQNTRLKNQLQSLEGEAKKINEIVDNPTSCSKTTRRKVEFAVPVASYITSSSSSPTTPRHRTTRKTICNRIAAVNVVRCVPSATKKKAAQLEDGSTRDVHTTLTSAGTDEASGCNTQGDGVKINNERSFTKSTISPDDRSDGKQERTRPDDTCIPYYPNGDYSHDQPCHEIHTAHFKRYEFADGTSKTVYADGREETKFPSGHMRMRDPRGRVLFDTSIDLI